MNIKLIPEKYILKRWTREARGAIVQDISGRTILDDPKLDVTRRYRNLCREFIKVASRAASFKESSELLASVVGKANVEIEQFLANMNHKEDSSFSNLAATAGLSGQFKNVSGVTLKKKEQKTRGRRKKSWNEKFHKRTKRGNQDSYSNGNEETENDNLQLIIHQETTNHNIDMDTQFMNNELYMAPNSGNQGILGAEFPIQNAPVGHDMNSQFQQLISQGILGDLSNDEWLNMPFEV